MTGVDQYVKAFIEQSREMLHSLTDESGARVGNLDDFSSPCQIDVVWLRNTKLGLDSQLWLVTHFDDEPDCRVVIHGPIESTAAAGALASIAEAERFDRPIPEQAPFLRFASYRLLVEGMLVSLVDEFRNRAIRRLWTEETSVPHVSWKQWLSRDAFVWLLTGSPSEIDYNAIVERIVADARAAPTKQGPTEPAAPVKAAPIKKQVEGFGTYIYPHVWIGSRPSLPFQGRLVDKMYLRRGRPPFASPLAFLERTNKVYLAATNDGFIAVGIKDRVKALRAINLYMAMLTLQGIPAFAATEGELGQVTLDPTSKQIARSNMPVTLPRMQPLNPTFVRSDWEEELMPLIEGERAITLWADALDVLQDDVSAGLLELFGETYKSFQLGQHVQSVLMAWVFVEQWVNGLLKQWGKQLAHPLGESKVSHYGVLDSLSFFKKIGLIDKQLAADIRRLQKSRNSVIHDYAPISTDEAEAALLIVTRLLKNLDKFADVPTQATP